MHLVIPFADAGSSYRLRAYDLICNHYGQQRRPLQTASGAQPFNKARTVNLLILERGWPDDDVIVLNDADTFVAPEQWRRAVEDAAYEPGLIIAFDSYWRLDRPSTERLLKQGSGGLARLLGDPDDFDFERVFNQPGSAGVCALSVRTFSELGGLDEQYLGWGYEDLDFVNRAATLYPLRRITGPAYHLWHDERRPDDSPTSTPAALVKANLHRYTSS